MTQLSAQRALFGLFFSPKGESESMSVSAQLPQDPFRSHSIYSNESFVHDWGVVSSGETAARNWIRGCQEDAYPTTCFRTSLGGQHMHCWIPDLWIPPLTPWEPSPNSLCLSCTLPHPMAMEFPVGTHNDKGTRASFPRGLVSMYRKLA